VGIWAPRARSYMEQFDADPLLFSVGDGKVVELGVPLRVRAAAPADMLRKGTDVCLPEDAVHEDGSLRAANCPQWLEHLWLVTGADQEYQDYLHRFIGHLLLGDCREQ